jgi:hypothetical protein
VTNRANNAKTAAQTSDYEGRIETLWGELIAARWELDAKDNAINQANIARVEANVKRRDSDDDNGSLLNSLLTTINDSDDSQKKLISERADIDRLKNELKNLKDKLRREERNRKVETAAAAKRLKAEEGRRKTAVDRLTAEERSKKTSVDRLKESHLIIEALCSLTTDLNTLVLADSLAPSIDVRGYIERRKEGKGAEASKNLHAQFANALPSIKQMMDSLTPAFLKNERFGDGEEEVQASPLVKLEEEWKTATSKRRRK